MMSGFIGRGPRGPAGLPGADGKDGKDGIDGKDGKDGKDGRDGIDGKDGRDGADGKDGRDGVDGRDGRDGVDGKDGADGLPGEPGPLPDGLRVVVDPGTSTLIGSARSWPTVADIRDANFFARAVRFYHVKPDGTESALSHGLQNAWVSPKDLWDALVVATGYLNRSDWASSSRSQEWSEVTSSAPTGDSVGLFMKYTEDLNQVVAATHLMFYDQLVATQPGAVTQSLSRSLYAASRRSLPSGSTLTAQSKIRIRVEIELEAVSCSYPPEMQGKVVPHVGVVYPKDVAVLLTGTSTSSDNLTYISKDGAYAYQTAETGDAAFHDYGQGRTALRLYERSTIRFLFEWYHVSRSPGLPQQVLSFRHPVPLLLMMGSHAD